MVEITLRGFADFMISKSAKQRRILHEFKYPDTDEARTKIQYYREARNAIAAFHKGRHKVNWLMARADGFLEQASVSSDSYQKRLNHNHRALAAYANYFANQEFEVLDKLKLHLRYSDVQIAIHPDLHVRDNGLEKIIKLGFSVDKCDERIPKIIAQCMFEAARDSGLDIPSSSVLYLDVARGKTYQGARLSVNMRNDIRAACDTIADIWPRI